MKLSTLFLPTTLLVFVGWQQPTQQTYPHELLKEETMTLEYTPAEDEIVVVVAAESELAICRFELLSPDRSPLLKIESRYGSTVTLQGFLLETRESTPEQLFQAFPEGTYRLVARTATGQRVLGRALFSHELLPAPVVIYPEEGMVAPLEDMVVRWESDPNATSYEVVLEQGDSDQLTATMPAGSDSFQVPLGLLQPGLESHVEIIAVGFSGNRTVTEIPFVTAR